MHAYLQKTLQVTSGLMLVSCSYACRSDLQSASRHSSQPAPCNRSSYRFIGSEYSGVFIMHASNRRSCHPAHQDSMPRKSLLLRHCPNTSQKQWTRTQLPSSSGWIISSVCAYLRVLLVCTDSRTGALCLHADFLGHIYPRRPSPLRTRILAV